METAGGINRTKGIRDSAGCRSSDGDVACAAMRCGASAEAEALETLCRDYWPIVYAYVRRRGYSPEEAQDLTQEFFRRLLKKQCLIHADPAQGKLRNFLFCALHHFLVSERRKEAGQKRGGGRSALSWEAQRAKQACSARAVDETTPEKLYEQRWARMLMARVLARLHEECMAKGKGALFELVEGSLGAGCRPTRYAEIAAQLGVTAGAVGVSVYRWRKRCRDLLRDEIAQVVDNSEEIAEEIRHLRAVFSR